MSTWKFRILYDRECPLCRTEVHWLLARCKDGGLQAEDISAPDFDPARYGVTRAAVIAELHGVLPDGTVTRGMESVRRSWQAAGLGGWIAWTRWPLLRPLADFGYRLFARHRIRVGRLFGRRCDSTHCAIEPPVRR